MNAHFRMVLWGMVAMCSTLAFAVPRQFTVKIASYSGSAATNIPLLLRLSSSRPSGFSYADTDGSDFVIKDSRGKVLSYEIGTWNPEGESTLWVKVPNFAKNEVLTVTYGSTQRDMSVDATEVWKGYVGVWHFDSTNGMDAAAGNWGNFPNSTSVTGIDGQMAKRSKADENGVIGKSVMIADPANAENLDIKNSKFYCKYGGVFVPDSGEGSPLDLGDIFTVSGWFKKAAYPTSIEYDGATVESPVFNGWDHMIYKREKSDNTGANSGSFAIEVHERENKVDVRGSSSTCGSGRVDNPITEWTHLAFVYCKNSDGDSICRMYENGALRFTSPVLATPVDNNLPLSFGNNINGIGDGEGDCAWLGWIDEVRLTGREMSGDEIAAEYAAMVKSGILEYSAVKVPSCTLSIERNVFFADDSVSVTVDGEAWNGEPIPEGASVTLAATPGSGGTFRKWYGDVPRAEAEKNPITFTAKENMWIYCRIVHPWSLALDDETQIGTMTDGNFTVNVGIQNKDANRLYVSHGSRNLLAETDTGSGILDLGGTITRLTDGSVWTISKLKDATGSQCAPVSRQGEITGYITPGTVTEDNRWGQLFNTSDAAGNKLGAHYTNLIIADEPHIRIFFPNDYSFNCQSLLQRLVLDLPLITTLPSKNGFFRDMGVYVKETGGLNATKFDWFNFPLVDTVSNMFFGVKASGEFKRCVACTGKLSFPSLRGTDWKEGFATQFSVMPSVEEISLGGITEATTVTNLSFYSFAANTSLKKLTLHADANIKIGSRIFATRTYNEWKKPETEIVDGVEVKIGTWSMQGRTPDVIHFTGAAISEAAIANLLDQTDISTAILKPVEIHASKWQPGWSTKNWGTPAGWISEPTEEEKAAYSGEEILGVFRAGAAAPAGKAIILHRDNGWDKQRRAFSIVVR